MFKFLTGPDKAYHTALAQGCAAADKLRTVFLHYQITRVCDHGRCTQEVMWIVPPPGLRKLQATHARMVKKK